MTWIALVLFIGCRSESNLPKLFPVPDAALVDQNGRSVRLDSMKGSVTVYDFIFTSCAGICPVMSRNMAALTKKFPPEQPVRFVSITVDPARDTPEALRAYAQRFGRDDRWTFLTGNRDAIVRLSVDGFKLAADDSGALLHSSKFVVADRAGTIREYYDGTEANAAEHVAATVKDLLRE